MNASNDQLPPVAVKVGLDALVLDLADFFLRPVSLFQRMPRQNRGRAALVCVLLLQVLLGWAVVSTGVYDYEILTQSQRSINEYARRHEDDQAEVLEETLEAMEKGAEFQMLLNRLWLWVGGPVRTLGVVGALTGLLFAVAALTGSRPDGPLLAGVVAFACLVEIPKRMLELWLMIATGSSRVETSLAAFATDPDISLWAYLLLRRLDPFEMWFWAALGVGLYQTGQTPRKSVTAATVVILALFAAVFHMAADVMVFVDLPTPEAP